jgi:hypothetical protein
MYRCIDLATQLKLNGCIKSQGQVDCTGTCRAVCGLAGCSGSGGQNICCDDASSPYNAEACTSQDSGCTVGGTFGGSFNCFDGDPQSSVTTGGSNGYYGNGTTIPGKDYMCILNQNSTTPIWVDPTSGSVTEGGDGGAPICPSTRRLFEQRMEEMFSSYKQHNSKVQLIRPQPNDSETMATKAVDMPAGDEPPPCRMGVPIADVRKLSADQCNPSATPEKLPLEIISRSGKTVTFLLSQVWKEGDYASSANKMDWIAADFVVPENGQLECFKTSKPAYGIVNAFTAKCTEGRALIDIYAVDQTSTGVFYQTDGSSLTIPDACAAGDEKGDATMACKFRYVLNCLEACKDDKGSSTWWSKITDAFRLR